MKRGVAVVVAAAVDDAYEKWNDEADDNDDWTVAVVDHDELSNRKMRMNFRVHSCCCRHFLHYHHFRPLHQEVNV